MADEDFRGFGPLGILALLVIVGVQVVLAPLGAFLVLLWARLSRTPWAEIGFSRPRSWWRTVVVGVLFGVGFKLLMKAVVMPLLGADPINRAYQHLVGNEAALPGMVLMVIVVAGFGEEIFYRGYLFERLGRLLGRGVGASVLIVMLTSALFGLAHVSGQGWDGVKQATVGGLVAGVVYARTRQIWMLMIMHIAFDLTAVWIIYSNLEWTIAHWVFK